jgi:MFS family permease
LTSRQHLELSLYWLATNLVWGALLGPVLSNQVAILAPNNSAEALGLLYFLAAVPALVIPLVVGPISDRFQGRAGRRRPFIELGGITTAVGLLAMSYSFGVNQPGLYLLSYVLVQVGANTAIAAYTALMPDLVPHEERGRASAYMAVMSNVGTLMGLTLAALTKHFWTFDWQTEIILAGVLVFVLIIFLKSLKETPLTEPPEPLQWKSWLKSLWIDPRTYPDFGWVWITRAVMMLGFYMIQPFLVYYLRDLVGVKDPGTQVVYVLALILLAATISAFLAGKASDKIGRKPLVRLSALIVGGAALAFPFLHSLAAALVVGLVFGVGYGAYISVDWALGTEVLPNKNDAAKDLGVWHIAMIVPQQLGAVLSGSVILAFFHGPKMLVNGTSVVTYLPGGYFLLFLVAAGFFALSGLLIVNVKGVR